MIITRLMGGLGNQMFQYAAGYALAKRHQTDLLIDLSFFEEKKVIGRTPRQMELHIFDLIVNFPSEEQKKEIQRLLFPSLFSRISQKILPSATFKIHHEPHFHFDDLFLQLENQTMLVGYWQSEKYFADCRDDIRKQFCFQTPPSDQNKHWVNQINQGESVAIHIRRGDYISNVATAKHHPVCPAEYYAEAMRRIESEVKYPIYFVFSDDPDWTTKNISSHYPISFLTHNTGHRSFEDLRLIATCKHHIIANSSFSWWGAWLAKHDQQQVIAPQKWFNDPGIYTDDLFPANWRRI